MGTRRVRGPLLARVAMTALLLIAVACGDDDTDDASRQTVEEDTDTTADDETDDTSNADGVAIAIDVLDDPPEATGSTITAELAIGAGSSVISAWLRDDRATAERFVTSSDVLDELFSQPAPSQELDEEAYCGEDPETPGHYLGCSFEVADDSDDGVVYIGTEVDIADGLVLISRVGFVD